MSDHPHYFRQPVFHLSPFVMVDLFACHCYAACILSKGSEMGAVTPGAPIVAGDGATMACHAVFSRHAVDPLAFPGKKPKDQTKMRFSVFMTVDFDAATMERHDGPHDRQP